MALQRVVVADGLPRILEILEQDGGVIVEDLVDKQIVDQLRNAVIQRAESVTPGADADSEIWKFFHGNNTVRFTQLGKLSPAFFDILENETFHAVTETLLNPICPSYWLNTAQAMLIGPGEPAQMLHRDCGNWNYLVQPLWPNAPEVTVSIILALDEVTEELGATRVIPGSHKWEDYSREGTPDQTVPAELPPGGALLYTGKVIHGGGENKTTDQWRMAMHMSFTAGWLTPEECSTLEYSWDDVKDRSEKTQRLLGFKSYDPMPTHPGGRLWLRDFEPL